MSGREKGSSNPELHRFDCRVITASDGRKQPAAEGRKRKKISEKNVGEPSVTQPAPQFEIDGPLYFDSELDARTVHESFASILGDVLAAAGPNINDIASSDSDEAVDDDEDDDTFGVETALHPAFFHDATSGAHATTKISPCYL
ncbi:hypothetical protein LINGRAHAP2_LOCUS31562 [Linum grandiflorum]